MLALLLLLLTLTPAHGADMAPLPRQVQGLATVVDGDGLWISDAKRGRQEIRLFGIDAPEVHEGAAGRTARSALEALVSTQEVTCLVRDRDRYNRLVAVCTVEETGDLGASMLGEGQAVTYRRYLLGTDLEAPYLAAERAAQARHLGVWAEYPAPSP
jgi:endonuclease YncB( thermonuclease family)